MDGTLFTGEKYDSRLININNPLEEFTLTMKLTVISCANIAKDPINNIAKFSYLSSIESLAENNYSPLRIYCIQHDTNMSKA